MAHTLKAIVRYDGTGFAGWQIQPNARTVQGEIERALSQIVSQPVRVMGSGRTDAGVHALGQVCSFEWPGDADTKRLCRSLSRMLGPEIRIESVDEAPESFNARFSATSKRYAYAISDAREPDPFAARYAWHTGWPIDRNCVHALAQRLVGQHDFAGFQCSGAHVESTVRTVYAIDLKLGGFAGPCDTQDVWRLEFHGDGFLYKMVRNIVGTLVDVARDALPEERLADLLASPGPFHGHSAPAHGLALMEVRYDA